MALIFAEARVTQREASRAAPAGSTPGLARNRPDLAIADSELRRSWPRMARNVSRVPRSLFYSDTPTDTPSNWG